jgi:predicted nuclease with RNAse H fold
VDLSAEERKSAVAWLDFTATGATVENLLVGAEDDQIIEAISGADKAGIDCPFGWPDRFVAFIAQHYAGRVLDPVGFAGKAGRRQLAWRLTDDQVRRHTDLIPLSVSADRIGHVAMRCACLLAQLADAGQPVDRAGDGVAVEVYPAASLKTWGLPHRGYKGADGIGELNKAVDSLVAAAPWLQLGAFETWCRTCDDAFDAVVCALTARAALLGQTMRPQADQLDAARAEGWIALPSVPLSALPQLDACP